MPGRLGLPEPSWIEKPSLGGTAEQRADEIQASHERYEAVVTNE